MAEPCCSLGTGLLVELKPSCLIEHEIDTLLGISPFSMAGV